VYLVEARCDASNCGLRLRDPGFSKRTLLAGWPCLRCDMVCAASGKISLSLIELRRRLVEPLPTRKPLTRESCSPRVNLPGKEEIGLSSGDGARGDRNLFRPNAGEHMVTISYGARGGGACLAQRSGELWIFEDG
jgi:hypothetical protein